MNSIIVEPDTVAPKGHHLHQCPNCSTVWMHSGDNAGPASHFTITDNPYYGD